MLIAFVPIVAIEAWVVVRRLSVPVWDAGLTCSVANLVSTVIGLPVTWLALLILSLFLRNSSRAKAVKGLRQRFMTAAVEAPFFPPYYPGYKDWMISAGCLSLMVPYFVASYVVENQIAAMMLTEAHARALGLSILQGNIITYGILSGLLAFATLWSFIRGENPFLYQRIHAMARKGRRWFSNDPTVHRPGYFWLSAAGLLLMIRTGVQTCRTALAKRLPKRAGRQTTRHDSRSTTSGPHLSVTGSDLRSSGQPDRTEERVQKSQVPASSSILPQIPRRPTNRKAA
jgi:hypothetical protein